MIAYHQGYAYAFNNHPGTFTLLELPVPRTSQATSVLELSLGSAVLALLAVAVVQVRSLVVMPGAAGAFPGFGALFNPRSLTFSFWCISAVALGATFVSATLLVIVIRSPGKLFAPVILLWCTGLVTICCLVQFTGEGRAASLSDPLTVSMKLLTAVSCLASAFLLPGVLPFLRAVAAFTAHAELPDDRFRATMRCVSEPFFIVTPRRNAQGDLLDLSVSYLNDHALALAGGTAPARERRLSEVFPSMPPQFFRIITTALTTDSEAGGEIEVPSAGFSGLPSRYRVHLARTGDGMAIALSRLHGVSPAQLRHGIDLSGAMLHDAPFTLISTDPAGYVTAVNAAAEDMLGYPAESLIGRRLPTYLHDETELHNLAAELTERTGEVLGEETHVLRALAEMSHGEVRDWTYVHRYGGRIPVFLSAFPLFGHSGEVKCYVAVTFDVTERRRMEERIRHLALHDALTGLPNRVLMQDRLHVSLQQAYRKGQGLAVFMIDIDHFKRINDSLGHDAGDAVIRELVHRLSAAVRKSDTVARLGGDEFVVVVPELEDAAAARRLAGEILGTLSEPLTVQGNDIVATASIGIALLSASARDAETLLRNADAAMYVAKEHGRNNVQTFTHDLEAAHRERVYLERALAQALDYKQLSLQFQPLVQIRGNRLVGFEALLRWHLHDGTEISPATFIPYAESSGLIVPIGEWVLTHACMEARAIQERLGMNIKLAVNISPRQFQHAGLYAAVIHALTVSKLPPSSLDLEITESVLMDKDAATLDLLRRLRALGPTITIDDFGTGFSSLSYIAHFPIDRIKIDRSFIERIPAGKKSVAITNAIVAMAHQLGLEVVAEGVENVDQLHFLADSDCDIAQGFLIARPMSASSVGEMSNHGAVSHGDNTAPHPPPPNPAESHSVELQ